jgi:hypothetical protein
VKRDQAGGSERLLEACGPAGPGSWTSDRQRPSSARSRARRRMLAYTGVLCRQASSWPSGTGTLLQGNL